MAAGTGVVIMQARDCVEPKQTAKIGSRRIGRTTEALFERGFDVPGETQFLESRGQLAIQRAGSGRRTPVRRDPISFAAFHRAELDYRASLQHTRGPRVE